MKRLVQSRNLRLLSTSVLDQAVLSLGNFLIGVLLIRHATDVAYGQYLLAQSAILLLVQVQNAWVSGPLAVVLPHKPADERPRMIGSIGHSLRRIAFWGTGLAALVPLFCYFQGILTGLEALTVAAGLLAGGVALTRDYARSILLILARPHVLLYADLLYVGVAVAGALFAVFGPGPVAVWSIAALAVGGLGGWVLAYMNVAANSGWQGSASVAGTYWSDLRRLGIWSAVGAGLSWVATQSFNYVLASRLDLKAVADVNATRLLLMPVMILSAGMKGMLLPMASAWLARDGVAAMLRRMWMLIPGALAMSLLYMFIVWFFRDLLTTELLRATIAHRESLLLAWAFIMLAVLAREMMLCAVFALGQVQSLAWLTGICALVALPMMWFGAAQWGPVGVLIGQACGEVTSLVGTLWLARRAAARRHQ